MSIHADFEKPSGSGLASTWHPIARHHWHNAPRPLRKAPDIARPAQQGLLKRISAIVTNASRFVANALQRHQEERDSRAAVERMLGLEPHVLADIGLQRSDIQAVMKLPLSVNAATELRLIALQRRQVRR